MIEVSEPAERTVKFELTESDAYVLKLILGHVSLSSGIQKPGAFIPELLAELTEAELNNSKSASAYLVQTGIRIYDNSQEW